MEEKQVSHPPKILYGDALIVLSDVLGHILGHILGPEGDVWGWYPKASRTDDAGKLRYTTFSLVEHPLDPSYGKPSNWSFGCAEVPEVRMRIIDQKFKALQCHISSISGRDMNSEPRIYGGASSFRISPNAWGLAGSGAPELVDHLIVLQLLLCSGKIREEDYEARADLDVAGVREAMEEVGMNAGTYMAMKAWIEARFSRMVGKLAQ